MADAIGSALASTIMGNLSSPILQELGLAGALKTELENLKRTFTTIQAVIQDAEEKQWKSEPIRVWLRNLKDAAYGVDDLLDEFAIPPWYNLSHAFPGTQHGRKEIVSNKIMANQSSTSFNKNTRAY